MNQDTFGIMLQNLPIKEPPLGLHKKIMRLVFWSRFRAHLFFAFFLLSVSLFFTVRQAWLKIVEDDVLFLSRALLETWKGDSELTLSIVELIVSLIPIGMLAIAGINLMLEGYAGYLLLSKGRMFRKCHLST